jgi:hypothetical protein
MKTFFSKIFRFLILLGIIGSILFIFFNFERFNFNNPWYKKSELENIKSEQDQTPEEKAKLLAEKTSSLSDKARYIQTKGLIILDIKPTSNTTDLKSLNPEEYDTWIGSINCTKPSPLIKEPCNEDVVKSFESQFSVITKHLTISAIPTEKENLINTSKLIGFSGLNQPCSILPIPVKTVFTTSIKKSNIPMVFCNLDFELDEGLKQISQLSKLYPTIAITHKLLPQNSIDNISKSEVDLIISSQESRPEDKVKLTQLRDLISINNQAKNPSVLSFEVNFSDNDTFQTWADSSLGCVDNTISCTTILNKKMIKKPSYTIKTNTLGYRS